MTEFHKILKAKKLSTTRVRMDMLRVLNTSTVPLSEKELERAMSYSCDRATIYRNLNALTQKGILIRLLSEDAYKYKLRTGGKEGNGNDDHLHFHCTRCNRLICMKDIPINDYKLPGGFTKTGNHFLITGICKECNGKD